MAVVWSAAAIAWGNAVVLTGRHSGGDQWITLFAIPTFGVVGAVWLHRLGFSSAAIGIRLPRADRARVLSVLVVHAAAMAVVYAALGLWSAGYEQRALRTVRTVVGTALGEELIHRGVLVAMWANSGLGARWVVVANLVTFGLWHVAGAVYEGFHSWEVAGPFLLAAPLLYLRLRFGSILAPMAVHAATNLPGVLEPP